MFLTKYGVHFTCTYGNIVKEICLNIFNIFVRRNFRMFLFSLEWIRFTRYFHQKTCNLFLLLSWYFWTCELLVLHRQVICMINNFTWGAWPHIPPFRKYANESYCKHDTMSSTEARYCNMVHTWWHRGTVGVEDIQYLTLSREIVVHIISCLDNFIIDYYLMYFLS